MGLLKVGGLVFKHRWPAFFFGGIGGLISGAASQSRYSSDWEWNPWITIGAMVCAVAGAALAEATDKPHVPIVQQQEPEPASPSLPKGPQEWDYS